MTTKIWYGGTGDFTNPGDWSPTGVPVSGDQAIISTGTVLAHGGTTTGIQIYLGPDLPGSQFDTTATLDAQNETVGNLTVFSAFEQDSGEYSFTGNLNVSGLVKEEGFLDVAEPLNVSLRPFSVLDFTNGSSAFVSALTIAGTGPGLVINDGSLSVSAGTLTIDEPIVGNGSFEAALGSRLEAGVIEFGGFVSAGETVNLLEGGELELDKPMQFLGSIELPPPDLVAGIAEGFVILENTASTSANYDDGVLNVFDGKELVGRLRISSPDNLGFNVVNSGTNTVISTPGTIGAGSSAMATADHSVPTIIPVS